eukprot:scaffold104905_cov66-Phaeocystis_antarctica.AAC.5
MQLQAPEDRRQSCVLRVRDLDIYCRRLRRGPAPGNARSKHNTSGHSIENKKRASAPESGDDESLLSRMITAHARGQQTANASRAHSPAGFGGRLLSDRSTTLRARGSIPARRRRPRRCPPS